MEKKQLTDEELSKVSGGDSSFYEKPTITGSSKTDFICTCGISFSSREDYQEHRKSCPMILVGGIMKHENDILNRR